MPITTFDQERKAKAAPAKVRPVLVRPDRKRTPEFSRGDLLAVPLCILWGACLWLSIYGPWTIFGVEGNSGAGGWLSSLWALPIAAAKHLFGR